MISSKAMDEVLKNDPGTILDVGCGAGFHARKFAAADWNVTGIDILPRPKDWVGNYHQVPWQDMAVAKPYDCVWASHILEHQPNPGLFLSFCRNNLRLGGILAVTVPPFKHNVVGGHLTVWNMGLLFYNLILAGFDCSQAKGLKYGYNISVVVPFKPLRLPELKYDRGDIETLAPYFPKGHKWSQSFNGDLERINW